ncbi:site-specific recombinase XerC [Actinoplanes tereljensis]|uniref:Core-binding (CB) domain-containing protein n=1 Tax=Paractinoplanes tereljensis TaxID=571912 RepID=A0A919NVW8_9ACTN|nr:hypothetical protein [Actinoplanes tereljensis]GIF25703.1 hypothetical protein Ate02nite_84330 [Actinoplanes tereljensis]
MPRRRVPTVRERVEPTLRGLAPTTEQLYRHPLELLASRWGDTPLDLLSYDDLVEYRQWAMTTAVRRRTSVNGASAGEHAVSAVRRMFDIAIKNGLITRNTAKELEKPPRQESKRRPIDELHVEEMYQVVTDDETGILRFYQETGCRREGLLNMTPQKVKRATQVVILDEKGSKIREQPISSMMLDWLLSDNCILYTWTRRKNDGLFNRIKRDLDWANELGVSAHWLRHTTLSKVERVTKSMGLTAAFAGHKLSGIGATATYAGRYNLKDVCWAFTVTFGLPHPLVPDGFVPIGIDWSEPGQYGGR